MKYILLLFICFSSIATFGQLDSPQVAKVIVHKDYRLDILARKQAEINIATTKSAARTAIGYRLQVMSTNDRELAMKTRTQLLQRFPEQKTYMFFQSPYIKLKFGNFRSKAEAEVYKKQISRMLGGASIYYLSERIEVKPEKDLEESEN